jgi:hypothetical protein
MTNFIWREPRDPDTYHIGYKRTWCYKDGKRCPVENEYSILVSLHTDILHDLIGKDAWEEAKARIKEQPREVKLSLSLPLDMDYPVDEQP